MLLPVYSVSKKSYEKINYTYYSDGSVESIAIGGNLYSRYNYTDNSLVSSIEFANDQIISYDYDTSDRITDVYYNAEKAISYDYSNYGEVGLETDYLSNRMTSTITDDSYSVSSIDTKTEMFKIDKISSDFFDFHIDDDVISRNTIADKQLQTRIEYITDNSECEITNDYDVMGRLVNKKVESDNLSIISMYEYVNDYGNYLASQNTYVYGKNFNYIHQWEYEYDENGNVTNKVLKKDNIPVQSNSFEYDANEELVLIKDDNETCSKMTYDTNGNIIKKTQYNEEQITTEHTYSYDDEWEDKLSKYNNYQIIYDAVGNPIQYNGNEYQWTAGRRLKALSMPDNVNVSYFYDELGHRTKKIIEKQDTTIKYEYFWLGDVLSAMTIEGLNDEIDTVCFLYDFYGNLYGFVKNGQDIYLYEISAQGNVTSIYNNDGIVANYEYDEFGNITNSTENDSSIQYYNPFYYRSYFYDSETRMYYLLSRYYVPEWGRFLNGDAYFSTGVGHFTTNMFAYCDNNYVNCSDPYGYWAKEDHREWSSEIASQGGMGSSLATTIGEGSYSVDIDMSTNPLRAPINWRYNQRYHFDRRNYCDNVSAGEDTRTYYANIYIDDSLAYKKSGDKSRSAKLLGQALHFLQDVSSHGNVGLNSSTAAHGVGFDDPQYEWKNDNRNSVYKVDSNYQYEDCPKGYSSRYADVILTTSLLLILYNNSK